MKIIMSVLLLFFIGCDTKHHTPYKHPIVKDSPVVMELTCPDGYQLDVFPVEAIKLVQISCDPISFTKEGDTHGGN